MYVTCIMVFLIPLTCVTLCHFCSATSPVLFTKLTNYGMREKKVFWVYGCTQKNLGEGHHFFGCMPSFLCHFLSLFCLLPPFYLLQLYIGKAILLQKMGGGGLVHLLPPVSTALYIYTLLWQLASHNSLSSEFSFEYIQKQYCIEKFSFFMNPNSKF